MQGWKCFALTLSLIFTACSGKSMLQADCHSCTAEEQRWKDFSFGALTGGWQGSLETQKNDGKKKQKEEKRAELRFLDAQSFLAAKSIGACSGLPENAVVLNGLLWESGRKEPEFETFAATEDGKVAYGRIALDKGSCHFRALGRVMGRNRLALPSVQFSAREAASGRAPASVTENEISVEFLRFDPTGKGLAFEQSGRKPASAEAKERPALLIRVYKTASSRVSSWNGAEEYLYRLWKTN